LSSRTTIFCRALSRQRRSTATVYSALYTAIAEALPLPIIPVYAPNHSFVRFYFSDGSYLNWEPTMAKSLPDAWYAKELKIDPASVRKACILRAFRAENLSPFSTIYRRFFFRSGLCGIDSVFRQRYPPVPALFIAYHNRGTAYYAMKNIPAAQRTS
jgi:hypothetical protein